MTDAVATEAPLASSSDLPDAEPNRKRLRDESAAHEQDAAPRAVSHASSNHNQNSNSQSYVDVDDGSAAVETQRTSGALHGGGDSPQAARPLPPPSTKSASTPTAKTSSTGYTVSAAHGADLRKMKQATLPMFGVLGDSASVRKEILDRDAQIAELHSRAEDLELELKTRSKALEDELARRDTIIAFTESARTQMTERLALYQAVMRREMMETAKKERAEARRLLDQKQTELGKVFTWPSNGREVWMEGSTMRELVCTEMNAEKRKDEVEAARKAAHTAVKQIERERKDHSADSPDDITYLEAYREYILRTSELAAITSTLAACQEKRKTHERDKNVFMKEIRRVNDEDASPFTTVSAIGPDKRYILMNLLGKGGFSEVWRAFDLIDGIFVACKIHKIDSSWARQVMENYRKHAERELQIMRQLTHPNLTRLYDMFSHDSNVFVSVMEYCPGVDLDTYIKRFGRLEESDARHIVLQVTCALTSLANLESPVIHYDLKPANILLQTAGTKILEIKIADFGLSKVIKPELTDGQSGIPSIELTSQGSGTYWYLPPECFQEPKPLISNKVDVWSLGVMFFQMLYGRRPFAEGESQRKIWHEKLIVSAARNLVFPPEPKVSEDAKAFIGHCLAFNADERLSVSDLSKQAYLQPPVRRGSGARPKNSS